VIVVGLLQRFEEDFYVGIDGLIQFAEAKKLPNSLITKKTTNTEANAANFRFMAFPFFS